MLVLDLDIGIAPCFFVANGKRYEYSQPLHSGDFMPYCPNCGTKNEEGAEVCVNCQQPLYETRRRRTRREGCYGAPRAERPEEECFGLPHGGIIVGIIFGLLLLIGGILLILQQTLGISVSGALIGPAILIIIAILILAGAIYQLGRRR
jgi:hypothetical protein